MERLGAIGSQFAKVATSGNYADLASLPTIPGYGSSWGTGDTNAPAYTFSSGEVYGASYRNGSSLTSGGVLSNSGLSHADLHQTVGAVAAGTTITQVNGYAAYIAVNCAATKGGGSSVGVGFAGGTSINVDGAAGWGIAFAMIEQQSGNGTGRKMVGGELDFSPQYAATQVRGWVLTGIAGVQPADADGYTVGALYGKYWQRGFVSADRASVYALYGGLTPPDTGTLVSQTSQVIALVATDANSSRQESQFYADAAGMHLKGSSGARDFTVDNGRLVATGVNTGVELGSTTTAGTSYVDLHSSGTANDFDVRLYTTGGSSTSGNGAAGIAAGSLVVPAPPAGDNSNKAATTGWVKAQIPPGSATLSFGCGAVVTAGTIEFDIPYAATLTSLRYKVGTAGGSFSVQVTNAGAAVSGLSATVNSNTEASVTASGGASVAASTVCAFVISNVSGSPTDARLVATWSHA